MAYNSYIGIYEAKIDPKGRIVVPQSFRHELGEEFKICLSLDKNCLYVMDNQRFNKTSFKLSKLPFDQYSTVSKMFHAYAFTVKPDKQGRIVIPPQLRRLVNFEIGTPVSIAGLGMYIEVWTSEALEQSLENITPEDSRELKANFSFSDEDEPSDYE